VFYFLLTILVNYFAQNHVATGLKLLTLLCFLCIWTAHCLCRLTYFERMHQIDEFISEKPYTKNGIQMPIIVFLKPIIITIIFMRIKPLEFLILIAPWLSSKKIFNRS
jgi:L-asparagine transporter-like permease